MSPHQQHVTKRSTYHTVLFPYDSLNHKWICGCLNRLHKTHTSTILPRAHISVYNVTWNGSLVTYTEAAFRLQLLVLFACLNFNTKKMSTKLKAVQHNFLSIYVRHFFPSCSSHVDINPKVSALFSLRCVDYEFMYAITWVIQTSRCSISTNDAFSRTRSQEFGPEIWT